MKLNLSDKRVKVFLLALAFIVLGFLPYLMSIDNSFVSDDWHFLSITANSSEPLYSYFTSNYKGGSQGGSYRPMVNVFWFSAYSLFGLNPEGYHILNIIFHTLNIFLIFLIIKNLPWFSSTKKKILAWSSCIIFAFLPNHASAVNWISVINDTMMTSFYLGALFSLLKAFKAGSKLYYLLSLLLLSLSILTKEMALTFPLISGLFICFYAVKSKTDWKNFLRKILYIVPHGLIILSFFVVRYYTIGLFLSSYKGPVYFSFAKIYRSVTSFFLSNFLIDEPRMILTGFLNINFLASTIALCCIIFLGIIITKNRNWSYFPWILGLAFILSLIPVFQFNINFTPTLIYMNTEGARYAYLPSVFVAVLVGFIFAKSWVFLRSNSSQARLVLLIGFCSIVSLLGGQLLVKNFRWNTASQVSASTLSQTKEILNQNQSDGVVLVGKPDSYRGAFIFRNGFKEALQLTTNRKINLDKILSIWAGTVYKPNQSFRVNRVNTSTFTYSEKNNERLIVSSPEVKTDDYNLTLKNYKHNIYSISHVYFGSKVKLTLSDKFVKTNQDNDIKILYYNNKNWIVKNLIND
jgi:hypothetical protein